MFNTTRNRSAPADCPHCRQAAAAVHCDSVTPIENRVSVLILQHPQEHARALGTGGYGASFQERGRQDRPVVAEPLQGAGPARPRSLALAVL